jgi:hypothetical protein
MQQHPLPSSTDHPLAIYRIRHSSRRTTCVSSVFGGPSHCNPSRCGPTAQSVQSRPDRSANLHAPSDQPSASINAGAVPPARPWRASMLPYLARPSARQAVHDPREGKLRPPTTQLQGNLSSYGFMLCCAGRPHGFRGAPLTFRACPSRRVLVHVGRRTVLCLTPLPSPRLQRPDGNVKYTAFSKSVCRRGNPPKGFP